MIKTAVWPLAKVPLTKIGPLLNDYASKGLYPLTMAHIASKDGPGALFVTFGETSDPVIASASPDGPGPAAEASAGVAASAAQGDTTVSRTEQTRETATAPATITVEISTPKGGTSATANLGEAEVIAAPQ